MTTLRPFQLEGCRQIYRFRGRALLADEQGLGKTIQALYWIRKIPKHRPVVIVVPASVKYTWQAEAAGHFNMRTEVLEGRRPSRLTKLPGEIIILNYDILHSWMPALLRHRPAVVVFDEVQYIKNPTARRTRCSRKLAEGAASVLGLSGTPIVSRPIEFFPFLNILLPDEFPDRSEYAWDYCKPRHTRWGWKFDGATNCGELNRRLYRTCMIRRLKRKVLPELPPKQRAVVSLRLKRHHMEEYLDAEQDFLSWLKERSPARHARAKKSPALTKVGYLLRLVAEFKLPLTIEWLEQFHETHPDEKIAGFTMHTPVIERLANRFPDSVVVNGSVKGRMRFEAVRRFQSNRKAWLFLGNWVAAGIGITLTAACNGVSLDFPWTPGLLLQGEDRLHRIGQKRGVLFRYLVATGTIEEKLMKVIRKKAEILDAILDGRKAAGELGVFDELFRQLM